MSETYIQPDLDEMVSRLANYPADTEVVMLNLLRFSEAASYPEGSSELPCTGGEAMVRYHDGVTPLLAACGAQLVWQGSPQAMLIGPQDKNWQLVALMKYPSAAAFLSMVQSPEYQVVAIHRTAALADSRLIAVHEL